MIAALVVASLLAGGPAPCAADPSAPPTTARVVERWHPGRILETAVVACDRRSGRSTVLRRAWLFSPLRGRSQGRVLEAASAAGRRVAWAERRIRRRVTTGRAAVSVVRRNGTATVLRERRVLRTGRWAELDVALTTRGELAWLAGERLVVEHPGRRPRVAARGEFYGLGVDDDRTLRWSEDGDLRFLDLRPWPAGTCPDGSAIELDVAGPVGLSALTADGPRVRWLHDGAPRAAEIG
jgi:hypothetical protein